MASTICLSRFLVHFEVPWLCIQTDSGIPKLHWGTYFFLFSPFDASHWRFHSLVHSLMPELLRDSDLGFWCAISGKWYWLPLPLLFVRSCFQRCLVDDGTEEDWCVNSQPARYWWQWCFPVELKAMTSGDEKSCSMICRLSKKKSWWVTCEWDALSDNSVHLPLAKSQLMHKKFYGFFFLTHVKTSQRNILLAVISAVVGAPSSPK